MKLTPQQKAFLSRERVQSDDGDFILCCTTGDDRIAKNLSWKGLGRFVDFRWRYSWRQRSGYYNLFYSNEAKL